MVGLSVVRPSVLVAHDGSTTSLEAPVDRVPPGSELPLLGLDFFPGESLRIRMTGNGAPVDVGVIVAGSDGHFEQTVTVPPELPPGLYAIDAISSSGIINRALVTVDAVAPPASFVPLFAPNGAGGGPSSVVLTPFVALALAVVGLATLVLRTRRPAGQR